MRSFVGLKTKAMDNRCDANRKDLNPQFIDAQANSHKQ
jgi:hypothetical protein